MDLLLCINRFVYLDDSSKFITHTIIKAHFLSLHDGRIKRLELALIYHLVAHRLSNLFQLRSEKQQTEFQIKLSLILLIKKAILIVFKVALLIL